MGFSSLAPPFLFLPSRLSFPPPSPSRSASFQHEGKQRGQTFDLSSPCGLPSHEWVRWDLSNLPKNTEQEIIETNTNKRKVKVPLNCLYDDWLHSAIYSYFWISEEKNLIRCALHIILKLLQRQMDALRRVNIKRELLFTYNIIIL